MARNVTTIIKDLNPRLKEYLNQLLASNPMQVHQVHEGSAYEPLVGQTKAWPHMGVFYDYLIRKELYNLLGQEALDSRASLMEAQVRRYKKLMAKRAVPGAGDAESCSQVDDNGDHPKRVDTTDALGSGSEDDDDDYDFDDGFSLSFIPDDETFYQLEKRVTSYQLYKKPGTAPLEIIEHIFNTAMLHRHFFGDAMRPFDPKLLNMKNVENVLKHVRTLNRRNIAINPAVGCKYFRGDADLILDDAVFDIKVSMHPLKYGLAKFKTDFYQLIFYALGVYVNEGKEIRKFQIYNPLLGVEYFVEIPGLDFVKFSKLVDEVAPL